MLIRLLENLLINTFNGAADRRAMRRARESEESAPTPISAPADYAVLGHVIETLEEPASSQAIAKGLSDAGIVALSPEARLRHLYLLGATGTGKTNLLLRLIDSDIANRRAFAVIDLRGDLVDRILRRLAAAAPPEDWKDRLQLMDLREKDRIVGFNPLQGEGGMGEGDVYDRALHLLSVLKHQSDSWGVQLEETLRNALLALAQTGWTLLEIEPLLTSKFFRSQVMSQVTDSRVRSFFGRYDALSAANQTTWALAVLNKVTPLLSIPALRLTFGQRQSLPFRDLFDQPRGTIFLAALASDRLHEAARLAGGLLVSSFQSAIMARSDVPEAQRLPVHLYVDEFESMASDRFETIVAEGRRFGLGLTLSHQNLNQLPSNLRHVLRNNVQTQIYFQTGALDAAELAREIGGAGPDQVRATLMSQGVGQAYLVRRGQPSVQMQAAHAPDPKVPDGSVKALRAMALQAHARPRQEVEAELDLRERQWHGAAGQGNALGQSSTGGVNDSLAEEPTSQATYEIRHSKTRTFEPQSPGPPQTSSSPQPSPSPEPSPLQAPAKSSPSSKLRKPVDKSQLDKSQLDKSQLDKSQLDKSQLDKSQLDKSQRVEKIPDSGEAPPPELEIESKPDGKRSPIGKPKLKGKAKPDGKSKGQED